MAASALRMNARVKQLYFQRERYLSVIEMNTKVGENEGKKIGKNTRKVKGRASS